MYKASQLEVKSRAASPTSQDKHKNASSERTLYVTSVSAPVSVMKTKGSLYLARPRKEDVFAVVQDGVGLHDLRRAVGFLDLG